MWTGEPCEANSCYPTQIANSDKSEYADRVQGNTGDAVLVTCDQGYTGGGVFVCQTTGFFNASQCDANPCYPTLIANSDRSEDSVMGRTGDAVLVTCDQGYTGGGVFVCQPNGYFNASECDPSPCEDTIVRYSDRADPQTQLTGVYGDILSVNCIQGYEGGGDWTCTSRNVWSGSSCTIIECSGIHVENSEMYSPPHGEMLQGQYGDVIHVGVFISRRM